MIIKNNIIGIDPGKATGLAIFNNGVLIKLCTCTPYELIRWLQEDYNFIKLVVFENSKLQSNIFSSADSTKKIFGKIARNIGQVDGFCEIIKEICVYYNIEYKEISPLAKGQKITHKQFIERVSNWQKQTNQHERDAVQVVMKYNYQFY